MGRVAKYFVRPKLAVEVLRDLREVCNLGIAAGRAEYGFRRDVMSSRQLHRCAICKRVTILYFDHQDGRGHGGGCRDDRIEIDGQWYNAALCFNCNTEKGSKRYHWVNGQYLAVRGRE